MNMSKLYLVAATLFAVFLLFRASAQDQSQPAAPQYVTIRWAGRDNTHLIRPGGKVEFIGNELRKLARPDRADERSFYMNSAMNALTKDGYEFAGMTVDEIVMKRSAR